ncbi:hypothetical protein CG723_22430 [Streptomyces sp. CB01635]|uniref:hypothetical protein n=1 Tax=unclassified Streptomyces TaxID=2593676 RepID=UPI000C272AB5|nr:hypothetical protein [Streptomyces sp. CB01635]PJN09512.1 hypothetical protein CG723_22430 [Streptomyces sp. CB01635]
MQSDGKSDRSSGLSTEDLAQTPDRTDRPQDEAVEVRNEAPTFPGESTAVPSAEPSETEGEQTETDVPAEEEATQLLSAEDEEGFRSRWQEVQSKFVDDPRDAVHSADALVAEVMQTLAATFAERKQELEEQWSRGERADTEDLRMALRHYRSFFNRLLTA